MCNTSRELDNKEKCTTLSLYMRKLQLSGYSTRLRADILQAAIQTQIIFIQASYHDFS